LVLNSELLVIYLYYPSHYANESFDRICREFLSHPNKVSAVFYRDHSIQNSSSRNYDPLSPSIKLMTMHRSKGLEFPVVFIPGLGHLPNPHGEVADEARLLYVAMTRAIEVLVLTGDRMSAFVERLKGALGKVG